MALGRVLRLRLRAMAIACALLLGVGAVLPSVSHAQGTRTLKLHFTHTGERGTFTYRRGGQYDRQELARINHILRDWRRNEPARMDPALLDLLWEVHRRTGSNEYIHVISAYRSPATNEALRRRSSGVAQNSQHTRGRAIDFFIPGVPIDRLRAIALTVHGGGVGYYPASGSPFVHIDTGSVRHWPRMTRQQLASLFPNGETLHLPSDGKPLPGYERAKARQQAGQSIAVASAAAPSASSGQGNVSNWLQRVFSRGSDGDRPTTGRERQAPTAAQPTAVARAPEPARPEPQRTAPAAPEPPRVAPAPRPAETVETEIAAVEAEVAVAASEAQGDGPPVPRAVPAKVRSLLIAARERAVLARMAAAAVEPSPAPGAPQARPEPAAVAALGFRQERTEADTGSADAALAGLYAAASGGNPETGAPRLIPAVAMQPDPAETAEDRGLPPSDQLAVALLALADGPDRSSPRTGGGAETALDAAQALSRIAGDPEPAAPAQSRVELAYALESLAKRAAAEAPPRGSEPQTERGAAPAGVPMPLVAVQLDRGLLQRLMSQETTRTGNFGAFARPQPRPDLYHVPPDSGGALALAAFGQPRTDRFQPR
jgi:uncharacterized protein YcbK (DUF882 family)